MKINEDMKALSGGYFVEHVRGNREKGKLRFAKEIRHKNTLVAYGAQSILQQYFQGAAVAPATFYMGVTNAAYTFDTATLAALHAGEPVGNGYARQAITQNNVDWTVQEVNGVMRLMSKICTFVASANWDKTWLRAFICDAAAGTAGNVIAVSGPADAARTVLSGAGPSLSYQFFLRG